MFLTKSNCLKMGSQQPLLVWLPPFHKWWSACSRTEKQCEVGPHTHHVQPVRWTYPRVLMKPLVDPSAYREQMSPMCRKLDILSDMLDTHREHLQRRKGVKMYIKSHTVFPTSHMLLSQKSKTQQRHPYFEIYVRMIFSSSYVTPLMDSHNYWAFTCDFQLAFAD